MITGAAAASAQGTPPAEKPAAATATQAKPPAPPATAQKPADPKAAQAAAPATPAQSPETKALSEASKLTDLDKQIEALKKVIADFPKSSAASQADNMILNALSRKTTADVKALQEHAKKWVEAAATPVDQLSRAGQAASTLSGAGVLLDDAEQYAKKSLGVFADEKAYVAAQKKVAADAQAEALKKDPTAKPRPEISDADWSTRYASTRQSATMTLAQIYEKKGKRAEAEKTNRDAYAMNPSSGGAAALKLADFAKASGHPYEQLEYLTVAALAGRLTAATRTELEALYKQTTGGTVADLDRMLDERYEKDATKVEPKPYAATKARTDRVVLAELFTGAGCPPCVAADLGFEGALERYSPKELALLIYHLHIPRPDPMTNPSTVTRKTFYDVPGTPTSFIDGGSQKVGGGAAANAETYYKDTIEKVVDKRLEQKADARVALKAAMAGDRVDVTADVKTGAKPDQKLRLQIALVEEMVHYTGENGVRFHPMVVSSMASTEKDTLGFAVEAGKGAKVTYTFDVAKAADEARAHLDEMESGKNERFGKFQFIERKSEINRANLRVVAFVQDEKTKEVLQTSVFDLSPSPAAKVH
jgi:tetratricopeptide (TPR) repeat protein